MCSYVQGTQWLSQNFKKSIHGEVRAIWSWQVTWLSLNLNALGKWGVVDGSPKPTQSIVWLFGELKSWRNFFSHVWDKNSQSFGKNLQIFIKKIFLMFFLLCEIFVFKLWIIEKFYCYAKGLWLESIPCQVELKKVHIQQSCSSPNESERKSKRNFLLVFWGIILSFFYL